MIQTLLLGRHVNMGGKIETNPIVFLLLTFVFVAFDLCCTRRRPIFVCLSGDE